MCVSFQICFLFLSNVGFPGTFRLKLLFFRAARNEEKGNSPLSFLFFFCPALTFFCHRPPPPPPFNFFFPPFLLRPIFLLLLPFLLQLSLTWHSKVLHLFRVGGRWWWWWVVRKEEEFKLSLVTPSIKRRKEHRGLSFSPSCLTLTEGRGEGV